MVGGQKEMSHCDRIKKIDKKVIDKSIEYKPN